MTFKDDLYHGVADAYRDQHPDGLARVLKVLSQASQVSPAGVLGRYAKVPVKQGTCHQFANEGRPAMEEVTEGPRPHPFNSPLETGIRALVVLEAFSSAPL